ncbi:nuclear transport factor 2 family protein [Nitratireductor sp. ZSWI3]|uniref:nuclear transport factor 2 family protein n=1 Tax=Nitratireductor sp. ZSWI3 TaxID=2966359 RepID=UPI00214F91A7|nr:nuclear transport factor 2 family protein [Nitratireductor sp. ZSWI3]MCR4268041.1 nuclear transport factor 2 family protein [Nitratireductor sp. ZSWI3]
MQTVRYLLIVAVVALPLPCAADDASTLSAWYDALIAADRQRIGDLLTDDARIHLDDLGIEQSKEEFLAALDEWEESVRGADIRYRVDGEQDGMAIVAVCYEFPGNQVLMNEQFRIDADRIRASVQSNVSDDCGDL